MYQIKIGNLSETINFAGSISQWLMPHIKSGGICISLDGELGSGKTTFVSALLRNLNTSDIVASPTYVLENTYSTPSGIFVSHWDLYRLVPESAPDELYEPISQNQLRLIEWASRSSVVSALSDLSINFEVLDESSRLIKVSVLSEGQAKGLALEDLGYGNTPD